MDHVPRHEERSTDRTGRNGSEPRIAGEFVEPSRLTLSDWLTKRVEVAKGTLRPSTVVRYTNVIEALQSAEIGKLPLQKVRVRPGGA